MRMSNIIAAMVAGLLYGTLSAVAAAPTLEDKTAALQAALAQAPECQNLGDYYWEVGNASGALARVQAGSSIAGDTVLAIASASKWVWGSYVVERRRGLLTPQMVDALNMRSGYDSQLLASCLDAPTIASCHLRQDNDEYVPEHDGLYSYNGGHAQWLAMKLGMGIMTPQALTADLQRVLGSELKIRYDSPLPSGGMSASAQDYALLLRKILRGELRMLDHLGSYPVCTLPGVCAEAVSSPSPFNWSYSLHHWVEDGDGGDGAFSSAGAFGFYPWISANREEYGVFARLDYSAGAGVNSAICGGVARTAWNTGVYPPVAASATTAGAQRGR